MKIFIIFCLFSVGLMGCEKKAIDQTYAKEIFPPHELFTVALFRMNNLNIAPAYFSHQWTTVLLGHSPCDERCMDNLTTLNNVTKGQKLFVFDNLASTEHMTSLTNTFKNVTISMGVTATSTDYFLAQFDSEGIAHKDRNKYFYFVNPDRAVAYSLDMSVVDARRIDRELTLLAQ